LIAELSSPPNNRLPELSSLTPARLETAASQQNIRIDRTIFFVIAFPFSNQVFTIHEDSDFTD